MKNLFLKYKEIIVYIFFGVLTTAFCWSTYVVFANICNFSVFISNLLSWVCGVIFAFITNKLWVFNSKSFAPELVIKEGLSFLSSRVITGVLEVVCVPVLAKAGFDNIFYSVAKGLKLSADIFYTKGIYSKLSFAVIVVILNYIFSKLFVFKKKNNDK